MTQHPKQVDPSSRLRLRLWGVRGSTPTPQPDRMRYGGNTPCLELRLPGGEVFVLDAGTGVRGLGLSLAAESAERSLSLTVFFTHFHWDHLQGLPFFLPLYEARHAVAFHAARPAQDLQRLLEAQMSAPFFPVGFRDLPARKSFVELPATAVQFGELSVQPFPLHHPQGATGFRFESRGAVIVYASDLEHGHPELDTVLRRFARGADVLVYDAQYTPEEYPSYRGWGHSTWLEATRVAAQAGVRKLVLFHHDPERKDEQMDELVQRAREHFENTVAAAEGLELAL